MLNMIHAFSILIAVIAFVAAAWLFFQRHHKSACVWALISICAFACFALYYVPFHIRLDSNDIILISFESGSHLVIDNSLEPSEFSNMDERLGALDFKRPFISDARIQDAFQRDTVTVTNGNTNIFIIFPSNESNGYAVLNQEAVADITDEFIQYISELVQY